MTVPLKIFLVIVAPAVPVIEGVMALRLQFKRTFAGGHHRFAMELLNIVPAAPVAQTEAVRFGSQFPAMFSEKLVAVAGIDQLPAVKTLTVVAVLIRFAETFQGAVFVLKPKGRILFIHFARSSFKLG